MIRRKPRRVRPLMSRVAVGAILAAVSACATSEPTAPSAVVSYSGEAFFRGVFFGDGPVGAMLPEVWQGRQLEGFGRTTAEAARVAALREEIVADVRSADPGLFERFGAAMRSGRHVHIERALDEAGERLAATVQRLAVADPTLRPRVTTGVAAEAGTYIVLVGLIAAVKVLVVYEYSVWTAAADAAPESRLRRDWLVDLIAVRFAADRSPRAGRAGF